MSKKHAKYHVRYPVKLNLAFRFIHKDPISNSFICSHGQLANKWNYHYLKSEKYLCKFILKQYLLC